MRGLTRVSIRGLRNGGCHGGERLGAAIIMVVGALVSGAQGAWAQTTNSPLYQFSPPAGAHRWHGTPDGSGMVTPYPVAPSRMYPADRPPALRDLTQRPFSPLDNAARDAGVRQQVYPAPVAPAEPLRPGWR